jgi:hypothetical protein
LQIKELGEMKLSPTATQQLTAQLGMFSPYFKKLVAMDAIELLDANVNYWLKYYADKTILLRNDNNIVRAVLSSRYKVIDNLNVLNLTRDIFMKNNPNLVFKSGMVAGGNMHLQFLSDQEIVYLEPEKKEDAYKFGISLQNSEVGMQSFALAEYVYRLVCTNGAVAFAGDGDFQRWFHIGGKKNNFDYNNDPQYKKEYEVTLQNITNQLEKSVQPTHQQQTINNLKELKGKKVLDPINFAKALKAYFMLSDKDMEIVNKVREGDSYYDWLQAITRAANYYTNDSQEKSVRRRIDLEKFGGLLMSDDGKIWGHLELVTQDYALKDKDKKNKDNTDNTQ